MAGQIGGHRRRQRSGEHLEEQEGVGWASMAVPPSTAALMAPVLVSVANVEGLVVATTSTFHHSGRPLLRVPTTWSCAGIGTLATAGGDGLPGRSAAIRERLMVGGWSIQVAVAVHWVGRRVAEQRDRDVERVAVLGVPSMVPLADVPVGSGDEGAAPTSQPVVAAAGSRRHRSSSSRCRGGPRWSRCSSRWTLRPGRRWGHRCRSCTGEGRWWSRCPRWVRDPERSETR